MSDDSESRDSDADREARLVRLSSDRSALNFRDRSTVDWSDVDLSGEYE